MQICPKTKLREGNVFTGVPYRTPPPPPQKNHKRGRYASYWNAFVFSMRQSIETDTLHHYLLPSATKLRRLCFYTCLSVILFTGGGNYRGSKASASVHAGIPILFTGGSAQCRDRHPPEQAPPRDQAPAPRDRHPTGRIDGYCCGRYASYWNAFLFIYFFHFNLKKKTIEAQVSTDGL